MKQVFRLAFVLAFGFAGINSALAVPISTPAGLSPGDQYRLVFVTSGVNTAASTDIADYNSFVSNAANSVAALAALGATWTAIASTAIIDARDNTETNPFEDGPGVRIFDTRGNVIATDNADLWDGTIPPIGIRYAETGASLPSAGGTVALVWTGTTGGGEEGFFGGLGSTFSSTGDAISGSGWVFAFNLPIYQLDRYRFYGISSVITVPGQGIPEPTSLLLFGAGLMGLRLITLRRGRAKDDLDAA